MVYDPVLASGMLTQPSGAAMGQAAEGCLVRYWYCTTVSPDGRPVVMAVHIRSISPGSSPIATVRPVGAATSLAFADAVVLAPGSLSVVADCARICTV